MSAGDIGAPESDTIYAPGEGDIILGFDIDTAANGGDCLRSSPAATAVLALADAISLGYVEFVDDGNGMTSVRVNSDGSAGAATAVTACTFADIAFVSNTAAATDFADNIGVYA